MVAGGVVGRLALWEQTLVAIWREAAVTQAALFGQEKSIARSTAAAQSVAPKTGSIPTHCYPQVQGFIASKGLGT